MGDQTISIAIETSCRRGGVAVGRGDTLLAEETFNAAARHGVQLICRLDEALAAEGLGPGDIREVYVSVGPGSFTGTRIGVTVARTLAQALPGVRCVAVPSPSAIAEGARPLDWQHLAVVLDAREGLVHVTQFRRAGPEGEPVALDTGRVMRPEEFLCEAPRPLVLLGEGLAYHDLAAEGITIPPPTSTDAPPHLPTAAAVWRLGRRLARNGRFAPPGRLLPAYLRKPEAVRLWERQAGIDQPAP